MANTREIKNRIESVQQTRKITNAMYLIASTKLRKARNDLANTRPYFDALRGEIKRVFRTAGDVDSPYFYPPDNNTPLEGTYGCLVITADKGLAGAYNQNVIKEAEKLLAQHPDTKLYVVGEYGRRYFDQHKIPIEHSFLYTAQNPTLDRAREISALLLDGFLTGTLKEIFVVYTDMESSLLSEAKSTRLLPFHRMQFAPPAKEKAVQEPFEFYPSVGAVLNSMIPSYVSGFLYSALLDSFYTLRDRRDAMRQKSQAIRKTVSNLCARLRRKLAVQEKELEATYDRERLRQLGDILTANIGRIKKGQTIAQCEDFYNEEMPIIDIPISPLLSPQQNAAKFYKDYTRMKNAEKELTHQISLGSEELSYLESVQEELNRAGTDAELDEIRQELQAGGYVRQDGGKARMKQKKLSPMRFESTDGFPIYVGRNNRQNDELTFRLARKDDIWCHASKVHGSHVIISCGGKTPPDNTLTQAAQLAAYYAETTGGQNIPVDMTTVKQVKKIPSGKPGMVIYHTYKTVIVNPYRDIVVDELNAE